PASAAACRGWAEQPLSFQDFPVFRGRRSRFGSLRYDLLQPETFSRAVIAALSAGIRLASHFRARRWLDPEHKTRGDVAFRPANGCWPSGPVSFPPNPLAPCSHARTRPIQMKEKEDAECR